MVYNPAAQEYNNGYASGWEQGQAGGGEGPAEWDKIPYQRQRQLLGAGLTRYHVDPKYRLDERTLANEDAYLAAAARYGQESKNQLNIRAPVMDWSQADADWQASQQARGQQEWLRQKYQEAIEGKGPSVAERQMWAGQQQAVRDAQSMAASARGGEQARLAAAQGARAQAAQGAMQTTQQAGILRAQEQIAAREGMGGLLSQQRQADLMSRGMSQEQARLTAQNELAQRQINMQGALGFGGLESDARRNLNQGYIDVGEAILGANTAAADRASRDKWKQAEEDRLDRDAWISTLGKGVAAVGLAAGGGSDIRAKTDIVPLSGGGQRNYLQELQREMEDERRQKSMLDERSRLNAEMQEEKEDKGFLSFLGGMSDKRAKSQHHRLDQPDSPDDEPPPPPERQPVRPPPGPVPPDDDDENDEEQPGQRAAPPSEATRYLDELQAYKYRYKPGYGPPGPHYGIMAQDAERTPMGQTMVVETPRGKAIDARGAMMNGLAADADLNRRLRYLERRTS